MLGGKKKKRMLGEIGKIFIILDGRASQAKYLHNTEKGKKKKC